MKKLILAVAVSLATLLHAEERIIIDDANFFASSSSPSGTLSPAPIIQSMLKAGWTVKHITATESGNSGGSRHLTVVYVLQSPVTNSVPQK